MNELGSIFGALGNTAGSLGKGLWSGLEGAGQGFANMGLDKLLNTGVDFWSAKNTNDMNKQLMRQRKGELGMQREAFDRDKAYQDALKGIDWTATA